MLDIKYIRENADKIQKAAQQKRLKFDVQELLAVDKKRVEIMQQIEKLQSEKNELNKKVKGGSKPDQSIISEGKQIKKNLWHCFC